MRLVWSAGPTIPAAAPPPDTVPPPPGTEVAAATQLPGPMSAATSQLELAATAPGTTSTAALPLAGPSPTVNDPAAEPTGDSSSLPPSSKRVRVGPRALSDGEDSQDYIDADSSPLDEDLGQDLEMDDPDPNDPVSAAGTVASSHCGAPSSPPHA